MSITTTTATNLIRTDVWSDMIKDILLDELMAQSYVQNEPMFGDGNTFHVPSVGELTAQNYVEDTPVVFQPLSTGDWTLSITEYKQAGVYITDKMKQDSRYISRVISELPGKAARAIMQSYEVDVFSRPEAVFNTGPNSTATINGGMHRFAASGANGELTIDDFSWAKNSLMRANVPLQNMVCIVSQNVATRLERMATNIAVNVNPMWNNVVNNGSLTGTRFLFNLSGWDIYVNNYLPTGINTDNALPVYNGSATVNFTTAGNEADVALFFSNASGVIPWLAAWRQQPTVEAFRNVSYKRDEISITARWGVGLYRPESVVEVLVKPVV